MPQVLQLHRLFGLEPAPTETLRFLEEIASGLSLLVLLIKIGKLLPESKEGLLSWIFEFESLVWENGMIVNAMGSLFKVAIFIFLAFLTSYYVRENWYLGSRSWSYRISVVVLEIFLCIWNSCFCSLLAILAELGGGCDIIRYAHLKAQGLGDILRDLVGSNRYPNTVLTNPSGHSVHNCVVPSNTVMNGFHALPRTSTPKLQVQNPHNIRPSLNFDFGSLPLSAISETNKICRMNTTMMERPFQRCSPSEPWLHQRTNFNFSLSNIPNPSSLEGVRTNLNSEAKMFSRNWKDQAGDGDRNNCFGSRNGNTKSRTQIRNNYGTPTAASLDRTGDLRVNEASRNNHYPISGGKYLYKQNIFRENKVTGQERNTVYNNKFVADNMPTINPRMRQLR